MKTTERVMWLSLAAYVIACCLPVYSIDINEQPHFFQGFIMLVFGWLSFIQPSAFSVWCANLLYFFSLLVFFKESKRYKEICLTCLIASYLAAICGIVFMFLEGLVTDEGGTPHPIVQYQIGYFVWMFSFVLMAYAQTVYFYQYKKKTLND